MGAITVSIIIVTMAAIIIIIIIILTVIKPVELVDNSAQWCTLATARDLPPTRHTSSGRS